MSESIEPPVVFTDRDLLLQGLIDGFLDEISADIHNGDKAIFKSLTEDGPKIDMAAPKWEISTEPLHVDISRRLRALRLVRYLSKPIFNPSPEQPTRKIDLGTEDEMFYRIDQYCEHYLKIEAVNQGGTYTPFAAPIPKGPRTIGRQIVSTFRDYDIHKKTIVVDGWQQVHSTYLAAPISQREDIAKIGF